METQDKKVLIVDDEAGLRRSLHVGLLQHGYAPDDAEDGLSALARIESSYHDVKPYSFVVADINLPDINGLKLLEVIKSRYPDLPVVLMSGYGTDATPAEVQRRRGDGYLCKPFVVDELTRVLAQAGSDKATVVEPSEGNVDADSASGYALIKLMAGADRVALFRQLYFFDHVLYCDAVRDRYALVLLLNGPTAADLDKVIASVRTLEGVVEVDFMPVARPSIDEGIRGFIAEYEKQHSVSLEDGKAMRTADAMLAYVLLEVAKERFNQTYPVLYFMDSVVSCDTIKGSSDLMLLLEAPSFRELDRIVQDEIRSVPGIMRARLLPIINMFEM